MGLLRQKTASAEPPRAMNTTLTADGMATSGSGKCFCARRKPRAALCMPAEARRCVSFILAEDKHCHICFCLQWPACLNGDCPGSLLIKAEAFAQNVAQREGCCMKQPHCDCQICASRPTEAHNLITSHCSGTGIRMQLLSGLRTASRGLAADWLTYLRIGATCAHGLAQSSVVMDTPTSGKIGLSRLTKPGNHSLQRTPMHRDGQSFTSQKARKFQAHFILCFPALGEMCQIRS